jgi:hypothetical protein
MNARLRRNGVSPLPANSLCVEYVEWGGNPRKLSGDTALMVARQAHGAKAPSPLLPRLRDGALHMMAVSN